MNNFGKRILALTLALMLILSCFLTGCGKSEEETTAPVNTEENTESTTEPEETSQEETEPTTQGKPKDAETIGAIVIVDNAAYEYYNFVQSTADSFISALNSAADKLSGKATVYSVIVPTSIDVTLDEATRASLNSSDQQKAINYFYGSMSQKIKVVNLLDTLRSHKDEYIYYRTDHHWTALGAYYGYLELAKAAGFEPVDINKFEKVSYGEFLGTFYSDSKQSTKLKKSADELIAYKPYYSTKMDYTDNKGQTYNWPLVFDTSTYPTSLKYSAFAAGDNPYTIIENKDNPNGKTCVVVKESFANAMIPFVAGSYKTVHVIDYRYWNGKLLGFAEKNGVDDVIFMNNISATRNAQLVTSLKSIIG